ncbi:MAG: hypothetical protein QNJ98_04380 [Planctomycetota bacterium]|nr:hypothetical protein [Planctomycetota bacterium]
MHQPAFATDADFNEQLYIALKQSPWWMISIAIHVFVFLIASFFQTTEPKKKLEPAIIVDAAPPEVIEPEPEDLPHHQDTPVDPTKMPEPQLNPEDLDLDNKSDNDLPNEENFGRVKDAKSKAPFDGPSSNGYIGTGGGAGSAFGRGGDGDGGGGGWPSEKQKDSVMDALRWLAAHQSPDGRWEAEGFDKWCDFKPNMGERPDGKGKQMYDVGVTGLALCAFLGAGYTHRGNHEFRKTVSRGLRYLKTVQDPEGCFGARAGPNYIYNHATAALAMVEAYGMTNSPILKGSAQRCLEFIGLARNPYFAWRYGVKPGDNDTSVTGWMMMAIKSAKLVNEHAQKQGKPAPLAVDDDAFDGIRAWLDKMTDPDYGRVGYITRGSGPARPKELVDRFPGEKSESMTAVGLLARLFMGDDPRKSETMQKYAHLLRELPPTWNPSDGSIDMYYWYYGALAMYQMGDSVGGKRNWTTWRKAMEKAILETQRKDTDFCLYKGSWDPIGPWGPDGGRVYSTAMMAMCMMVVERYDLVPGSRN